MDAVVCYGNSDIPVQCEDSPIPQMSCLSTSCIVFFCGRELFPLSNDTKETHLKAEFRRFTGSRCFFPERERERWKQILLFKQIWSEDLKYVHQVFWWPLLWMSSAVVCFLMPCDFPGIRRYLTDGNIYWVRLRDDCSNQSYMSETIKQSCGSVLNHRSPCSNLGVGLSEGCFIIDFASLPLKVARPI